MPDIHAKKIYIDTNLFVNHLFKLFVNHLFKKHTLSTAYLKNIENGNAQGITSILTIMETYTAGRKILAERTNLSLDQIQS